MSDRSQLTGPVRPAKYQPPLPVDQLILREAPDSEAVPMDVIFVGGGPAGLAGAIELARLVERDKNEGGGIGDVEIGVLEKAGRLGEHSLSGAVVNPRAFRELFPELDMSELPLRGPVTKESVYFLTESRSVRIPTPPTMKNYGNQVASICEIVRWLGEKAEGLGVNVFAGFAVGGLLVEGDQVIGVRTTASGLDRDGQPGGSDYMPPMDLTARVTVLAEGTRGPLMVSLGLVVGLDYRDARFDVHEVFQRMKLHPLFKPYLEGGEMVEWGAKTIPEGGCYSVPSQRHGAGVCIVGDSAGYVDVPSLKGIHYAMDSGMLAARAIFKALREGDVSENGLHSYTDSIDASYIMKDLRRTRNIRLAFKKGFFGGSVRAGLMTVSGGALLGGKITVSENVGEARVLGNGGPGVQPDGKLTFSKVDAVYKAGNQTRDDIPSHLIVGREVSPEAAEMYVHMCPAGVYERDGDELRVNAPNCVDCKATDVLGPRWTAREGGSGPAYRRM